MHPDPDADAHVVAGKGRPIRLDDGEQVLIRVDLDNLMLLEERYGSISAYQTKLAGLAADDAATRPVFTPLVRALAVLMPWQREDLRDPRTLARRLDPEKTTEYVTVAMQSLNDAVSTGEEPPAGRPNPPAIPPIPATDSLGGGSTTPAPLPWAVPTPSSGG